jgi:hypothetical protein
MDFMALLKSLEEALYEMVTWILFYPLTMWRSIFHPQAMMRYADTELVKAKEEQYAGALSPPIFLLLTLLIAYLLENRIARLPTATLPSFLTNDRNLLFFRALTFSIFPLLMSLKFLRYRQTQIDRKTLKPPFYSQSYIAAPFAFAVDAALVIGRLPGHATTLAAWVLFSIALVWYFSVETQWFAKSLDVPYGRAIWSTLGVLVQAALVILLFSLAIALAWQTKA